MKKSLVSLIGATLLMFQLTGCGGGADNGTYKVSAMGMPVELKVDGNNLSMNIMGTQTATEYDDITIEEIDGKEYLVCEQKGAKVKFEIISKP